jgi:hypothetical protein
MLAAFVCQRLVEIPDGNNRMDFPVSVHFRCIVTDRFCSTWNLTFVLRWNLAVV